MSQTWAQAAARYSQRQEDLGPKGNRGFSFGGLRVAAFESRRAERLERLLARAGAIANVSPSVREMPEPEEDLIRYTRRLIDGEFDVVILLTATGLRLVVETAARQGQQASLVQALAMTRSLARGPKITEALEAWGLRPTHQAPPPHTWRDILTVIDANASVAGTRVAVQESGRVNADLRAALGTRGATVTSVPLYRWGMPCASSALEANVRLISAGQVDVVLFTSGQQLIHLIAAARRLGLEEQVRAAMQRTVVGSVGPATSETLRRENLPVDIEPESHRMDDLVRRAAEESPELVRRMPRRASSRLASALPVVAIRTPTARPTATISAAAVAATRLLDRPSQLAIGLGFFAIGKRSCVCIAAVTRCQRGS